MTDEEWRERLRTDLQPTFEALAALPGDPRPDPNPTAVYDLSVVKCEGGTAVRLEPRSLEGKKLWLESLKKKGLL